MSILPDSDIEHRANAAAPPDPDAQALLTWYDAQARRLPWRAPPGGARRTEPYRVWLSEIMLQQTTVAAAAPYFERFTTRWPGVEALAAAPRAEVLGEWAGLGYYARARNLHACAQQVARLGGFPQSEAGLRALPGIGPYTAAAVAAIAFDLPHVPVDGNVERVVSRLFRVETPLPKAKKEIAALAHRIAPPSRHGDFAQALMDLGAMICTPRKPACALCPWRGSCAAQSAGVAEELPRKPAKKAKPLRYGACFVAMRGDQVLVETRPERGLLGGMSGPPSTDWGARPDAEAIRAAAPCKARWATAGEARHVFTHFELRLTVLATRAQSAAHGRWEAFATARAQAPTALRKALDLGRAALSD